MKPRYWLRCPKGLFELDGMLTIPMGVRLLGAQASLGTRLGYGLRWLLGRGFRFVPGRPLARSSQTHFLVLRTVRES